MIMGQGSLGHDVQPTVRLTSGFNSSTEIIILNASDPLFSDANVRMSQASSW